MNKYKNELLLCACHSPEHQLIFSYDEDDTYDGCVYLTVHLRKYDNFFTRILHAVKYIFGHTSKYGDFDEFIFEPTDYYKLERILKYLKICNNNKKEKND